MVRYKQMLNIDSRIKEWIESHIDLLESNQFTELYSLCNIPSTPITQPQLTELLYSIDCKPEPYLRIIPNKYLYRSVLDVSNYVFPTQVTLIGPNAFNGTNIEEVLLPEGVQYVKGTSFSNCSMLKRVVLPNSLIRLGTCVFGNTPMLTSIEYRGTVEEFKDVVKEPSWCRMPFEESIPVICTDGRLMSNVD